MFIFIIMYSQLFLTSDFKSSKLRTGAKHIIIANHNDCYEDEETIKTKRKRIKNSPILLSVKSLLLALLGLFNLANATYDYVNITTYDNTINYNSRIRNNAPIYQNEFAVYIPKGQTAADALANKYGFENVGQVNMIFIINCALFIFLYFIYKIRLGV